jgi:hypothetical protein
MTLADQLAANIRTNWETPLVAQVQKAIASLMDFEHVTDWRARYLLARAQDPHCSRARRHGPEEERALLSLWVLGVLEGGKYPTAPRGERGSVVTFVLTHHVGAKTPAAIFGTDAYEPGRPEEEVLAEIDAFALKLGGEIRE